LRGAHYTWGGDRSVAVVGPSALNRTCLLQPSTWEGHNDDDRDDDSDTIEAGPTESDPLPKKEWMLFCFFAWIYIHGRGGAV
jgi:hypothetical protein